MKMPVACILLIFFVITSLYSQEPAGIKTERPRLIVGIVVDQMRYDYLYRFREKYGAGGFNRLLKEGFSCENTHYNYMPTYTAPGHASIYTGTTPAVHGIIGNEWWDRSKNKSVYVTADDAYQTVGSTSAAGQQAPTNLLTTTITDQLRLSNNFRSKVVGVCIKDRGSILPAGHIPNACYWFDDATGNMITSTYYPDSTGLPAWVDIFNKQHLAQLYLDRNWTTYYPEETYVESVEGWNQQYENYLPGDTSGTFPMSLPAVREAAGIAAIRSTPYGNTFTLDFAMTAIQNMELGVDEYPDFLCLSFSSTDYVGHQFGVHSKKTEDIYIRLDAEIERFLKYLDEKFGKNNVLVFLTADHGVAETPAHMQTLNIPAGAVEGAPLVAKLNEHLSGLFGLKAAYVGNVSNLQVFFNEPVIKVTKISREDAGRAVSAFLRQLPGVYDAFSREELRTLPADYPFVDLIRRGIHPHRSGDVFFELDPGWLDGTIFQNKGTTHGSPYPYDTHVPLLWFGWQVPAGTSFAPVDITDIAPTLASMLRITEPNGTTGKVIEALMKK